MLTVLVLLAGISTGGCIMSRMWLRVLSLLLLGSPAGFVHATEWDVESRYRAQIEEEVVVGDVVELKNDLGEAFIAIDAKPAGKSKGTVILLHNMSGHPNWQSVIGPLSRGLPDSGWSTFSVQMPVRTNCGGRGHAVLLNESPSRIAAAIDYLQARGENNIIILGHGLGAIMAVSYLAESARQDIAGLVVVGLYMLENTDERMWAALNMSKLTLPILDIYGSWDVLVANARSTRSAVMEKGGNSRYQLEEIKGADINFEGYEDRLMKRTVRWLKPLDKARK